ncbi:hypothetical protein LCGC14_0736840 [marine sediment metagenome]|uniref:histidine kinase n=2 Tax=root TaxID=1 RepID=A0A831QSC3_9FLAO|nr:helix-turn-helix domain-containing protein [Pricia antarctica]
MKLHIGVFFLIALFLLSCSREKEQDKIRIGFSQCMDEHPWREAMNHSMKLQASLHPEIELVMYEARYDTKKQIGHLEKMIDEKVDIIIVSPMDPDALVSTIDKAIENNIPVILLDRKINSKNFTAFIGADNIEIGRIAGNYIVSNAKEGSTVLEIKGGDNSSPVLERSQGFQQIINQNSKVKLIKTLDGITGGLDQEFFRIQIDSLKSASIDYVYAFSDEMALQAWEVAKSMGIENSIKFIGIDGLNGPNGGIELVRRGIFDASILYPTGGTEAIKMALKISRGEDVPKMNTLGTTVIDRFNADIMKDQFDKINEHQEDIEKQTTAIKAQEELYATQGNLLKIMMALLTVVLSLTVYSIYSIITIVKKNKQLLLTNEKITLQRNEIERIAKEVKHSNEAKFNFFTGLSHEFKTPLTLIMSSIESVGEIFKGKKSGIHNEVELIKNNSNRLLRLMNNLLDFRKSEDQKFNIRASQTNINHFSKTIINEFQREAQKRQIHFEIESDDEEMQLYVDRNLMDKVYFNLLSNAFKFTPDNGRIKILIDTHPEKNYVSVKIKDNGIGIPENELVNVFQPFFKGSNNRKNSTGIGLHLSKQFIELHLGTIAVKSYHGTEFEIRLYKGNKHFNEDQIIVEPEIQTTGFSNLTTQVDFDEPFITNIISNEIDKHSILVIEDNRDLSQFLQNKLQTEFEVFLSDGPDGIEQAIEHIPDIILCDVNLPGKNGFEICSELKKDLRTSHIPTIILTALSDKESYLKGLQSGTDLYLTKPFSYSILIQSIKSLMYNREKLRFYYTSNIHKIEDSGSFGNIEQKFITTLNSLIQDNLGNSDFSVENLAESLHISRVQLYRKVKAMMGISISDYIGKIRLEKSKYMLESTSLTVAEIAFATGFSSPNYFSTAFKNLFGTSPGSFRKSVS